jgi:hypothetical protein
MARLRVALLSVVGVATAQEDHPILAASSCPTRLWQPNEVPQIHEVNVVLEVRPLASSLCALASHAVLFV